MICDEWRDSPLAEIAPLYQAERDRWRDRLHWDLHSSWEIVEAARASGRLPGLLARDRAGATVGWAFYLLFDGLLQIGGLVGYNGAAVRTLLDEILATPEAELAHAVTCFVYPESTSLESALTRRHFAVQHFPYLSRDLAEHPPAQDLATMGGAASGAWRIRGWTPSDAPGAVRLLMRAYEGSASARCYAPHGRLDEWAHYLGQLMRTPACGVFMPEASFIAESASGGAPLGFILSSALSSNTAHIAQVAVSPSARGFGLGRTLVEAACGAAASRGFGEVSLLVAEHNTAARALYARLGFLEAAEFVFGSKGASRVDRPAPHWQAAAL